MTKLVRIDAAASEEIDEAIDFYERARAGLGLEFLDEVSVAMRQLAEPGPECRAIDGLPAGLGVKRKLLRRFPYMIVFVELETAVRVVAVAHGARRPGYWRRRLGQG
jgi:toxin ParE1/3/4